jgi:hypothetical protein
MAVRRLACLAAAGIATLWSWPLAADPPLVGSSPAARVCRIAVRSVASRTAPPRLMTISNEGGWCVDRLRTGQTPSPEVVRGPSHGELRREVIDGWIIVRYRPQPGYTGVDGFALAGPRGFGRTDWNITVTP